MTGKAKRSAPLENGSCHLNSISEYWRIGGLAVLSLAIYGLYLGLAFI